MNSRLTVAPPPAATQPLLFDVHPDIALSKEGEKRARSGQITERVVNALLHTEDIPIQSRYDVNFDAFGYGRYFEMKSVKWTNSCPIYNWRHVKECECGVEPVYAFALHRADFTECFSLRAMAEVVSATMKDIYIVPLHFVTGALEGLKTYKMLDAPNPDSRNGYERAGYCEGYRLLTMNAVRAHETMRPITSSAEVDGLPHTAKIHVSRELHKLRRQIYQSCRVS